MQADLVRHRNRTQVAIIIVATFVFSFLISPPQQASAAYGAMIMPVSGHISATYSGYCDGVSGHEAIDITGNNGAQIVAAASGIVEISQYGTQPGWYIHIRHGGDYLTRYLHLASKPLVDAGDYVTQGQAIGYVGDTGTWSNGAHLHFAIWKHTSTRWGPASGYSCNQIVTKGAAIPIDFPGLSGGGGSAPTDYNSDGKSDIVAINNAGTMYIYRGNGNGGLSQSTIGGGWSAMQAITGGDYNGDGKGDMIATRISDGALLFYAGNGNLSFASSVAGNGWGSMSLVTGGGDFNGDGKDDIIAKKSDDTLWLYPGTGLGSFSQSYQVGNGWGGFSDLVAGDFNGDGKDDIIAVANAGTLHFYAGNGSSGFATGISVGSGWTAMSVVGGGADYNGDGKADLFARNSSNELRLYPGIGTGGFSASVFMGNSWGDMRELF